jgi:hypothetical protein
MIRPAIGVPVVYTAVAAGCAVVEVVLLPSCPYLSMPQQ